MVTKNNIPTRHGVAGTPLIFNTDQTADKLQVSRRTVQELAAERKLASIKFGRNIRFAQADIDAFIEANRVKAIGWKGGNR